MQTSIANQVNLVNTAGLLLNYWDGDAGPKNNGVVNGGDGTWQSSAGNDNWTEATGSANAPFSDGAFAVFAGAPGTVTVDDSLGAVRASGMQFAVDGYHVEGDADRARRRHRHDPGRRRHRRRRRLRRLRRRAAHRRRPAAQDRPRNPLALRRARAQLHRRHGDRRGDHRDLRQFPAWSALG